VTVEERRQLGDRIEAARNQLHDVMAQAETQARHDYTHEGVTETRMAADFRVNRLTIRRWLGK
jgi:hypothetical protein